MARLFPVGSPLPRLTLLFAAALGTPAVRTDVTVAPTPLYATPEVRGAPLRTLPTGKLPGSYTAPAPRLESTSGLPPAGEQTQRVEVTGAE